VPDSGAHPEKLVALARVASWPDMPPWVQRELLGAALYRAGQMDQAARELQEANAWRDKARLPEGADWRQRLIHRHLSHELDAKK
jgi:hypothetical protein